MGLLIDVLRSVEFLAGLPAPEVERFMVLGRCAERPRHHVFWRAGDEPEELVVTVAGEAITVARSGEFFSIRRESLWSFLDRNPQARRAAVTMLGRMYRRGIRDIRDVVFRPATQRVARRTARRVVVESVRSSARRCTPPTACAPRRW